MRTIIFITAVAFLAGCRTPIAPVKKQQQEDVYVKPGGCNVRRYIESADVPEGAQNLGWVSVEVGPTEEETFLAIDQKICALGGDALSTVTWEKSSTETTAERTALRAIAWKLP